MAPPFQLYPSTHHEEKGLYNTGPAAGAVASEGMDKSATRRLSARPRIVEGAVFRVLWVRSGALLRLGIFHAHVFLPLS